MNVLKTHVAGVDVHKEMLAITVLIGEADKTPEVYQFESKTYSEDLMACGHKLKDLEVTEVAMESTGVYWKAPFNIWDSMGIKVTVGQASQVRNAPGRKTDMKDSHWLAELHRVGLIRASFIPDSKWQQLRLVSRHRTNLKGDLATVKNRVQRVLEDGNVKLGSIVSDVFGTSGRQVVEAIASGITDATTLVSKITTKIKKKEEARKALGNCLMKEHCFVIRSLMEQLVSIEENIKKVDAELFELVKPYNHLMDKLKEIPGISDVLAIGILAETTDKMENFKDERSFAAWTGVAAGNNESAGKKKE